MVHRGRAVVFEDSDDFHRRIDDENLDVDENCVLVLKNCGPKGYPGMAEVGNMPLPPKVLRKGITDMVRISDGRMSGTATRLTMGAIARGELASVSALEHHVLRRAVAAEQVGDVDPPAKELAVARAAGRRHAGQASGRA